MKFGGLQFSASGFKSALFEQTESDAIGQYLEDTHNAMCDLQHLSKKSDEAPTNKICRRASSEQRPRTRSCHESERLV